MSKTKFITLGTAGGPTPKPYRMPPAHAIAYEGGTILIDCGEGAFQQLRRAGFDLKQVRELFITHHHFDHIGSLFACLGLNMMMHRHQPMNIYGPPGTSKILDHLIAACDIPQATGFSVPGQTLPHPRDFINSRDIQPGEILYIDDIRISCCENTHYRPEDQFGKQGPISLSYRFDAPDRSMVFTGDTGPCLALEEFAKNADLLVGEKKITQERQAFRADQFNRDGNWLAHYKDTTSEIWEATGGKLDGFADFLGSGGTYKGVTKGLKKYNSAIQCFVIEPEGAAPVAGKTVTNPNHPIQGGGYNMSNLKFLDGVPVDGFIQISGEEAQKTTRELAKHEGIFGGFSSGANVAAALKLLSKDMVGKTIVIIICDSGYHVRSLCVTSRREQRLLFPLGSTTT